MAIVIQIRRGTSAYWAECNTTLAEGEFGYEVDTKKIKLGDGLTAWNSLAYSFAGGQVALGADENFVTDLEKAQLHAPGSDNQDLSGLVEKVAGKWLSTEDYTTEEKSKLAGLVNYTDEQAQDASTALILAGTHSGISFDYDDTGNKLNVTVTASGSGDVTGPVAATDANIALFNGATGKVIKDSGVKLSDLPVKGTDDNFVTDTQLSYIHAPGSDNQDLSGLVEKVTGKGLSTEDYTTEEKSKLAGLVNYTDEQAQDAIALAIAAGTHAGISFSYDDANNKLSATVTASGSGDVTGPVAAVDTNIALFDGVTGKVIKDSGVKLSDLPVKGADDNFVTDTQLSYIHAPGSDNQDLSGLVEKVAGKGLSTEDYTTEEKSKLAGLVNYTDEQAQDAVAAAIAAGVHSGISFSYDDANNKLSATVTASGSGDVTGPAAAVDTNIALFDGATGKVIKDSGVKLSDLTTYTDEQAQDAVAAALAAGTHTGIAFNYDDTNNKISATVSGGGGSSITRYEAGAGTGCYVLASGPGVVITKTANAVVITAPDGVQVFSTSIHMSTADMAGATNMTIDFGINQGMGDNADYTVVFPPQYQVWNDVAGNRAYRSSAAAALNVNSHTLLITGLTAGMAIWVNLSF